MQQPLASPALSPQLHRTPSQLRDVISSWTPETTHHVYVFGTFAHLAASMNEQASLFYHAMERWSLVFITVLSVVVGSQSAAQLTGTVYSQGVAIALAICEIMLAVCAGLLSRMDWHGRAVGYKRKSIGYTRLGGNIRIQLIMAPDKRMAAPELLAETLGRIEELEMITDPLPMRYRNNITVDGGIMSMWGSAGVEPASASASASASTPAPMEGRLDVAALERDVRHLFGHSHV